MRLVVTIGNSNIKIGYSNGQLKTMAFTKKEFKDYDWKKIGIYFSEILVASVVPSFNNAVIQVLKENFRIEPKLITIDNIPIDTRQYDTSLLGVDRLLACFGALRYGTPCAVFDIGTAISISVITEGHKFLGGAILPGIEMGIRSLNTNTALLPKIDKINVKNVIGSDTASCIASGIVFGTASAVDGMATRIKTELGKSCKFILTGGGAYLILPYCNINFEYNPHLIIEGMIRL